MPTERQYTIDYLQTLVDELLPPPPNLADDDAETKAIREALLIAIEALKNGFSQELMARRRLQEVLLRATASGAMDKAIQQEILDAIMNNPPELTKKTKAELLRDRTPLDDL
jgi:hypothetical protein